MDVGTGANRKIILKRQRSQLNVYYVGTMYD